MSSVSVVIPAFNEEAGIADSVRRCQSALQTVTTQIIVVDDGSVDHTKKEAQSTSVEVVSYQPNMGKGFALKRGTEFAKGDVVVWMDAGSEIEVKDLSRYVRELGRADLAIGSKHHPESHVEAPAMRRFLSYGFHLVVRLLTGVQAKDTQVGLKVGRREAMQRVVRFMAVDRYAFDVEFLAIAGMLKLRVVELPVTMRLNKGFRVREMVRMALDVLWVAYNLRISGRYRKDSCFCESLPLRVTPRMRGTTH
jgi:dolichol-phosphate mannosyltransferase